MSSLLPMWISLTCTKTFTAFTPLLFEQKYDKSCDVFSFGVMMNEIFAEEEPYSELRAESCM